MFSCSSADVKKIGGIASFQLKRDEVAVDGVRNGERDSVRVRESETNSQADRQTGRQRAVVNSCED